MKILIADDDAIVRLLLTTALKKLGHEVRSAQNGEDAWKAWQSGEFPLVISDWIMPDLDGLEFCRRMRAEGRPDYTYLILLTSRIGKADYLAAMDAGADDFISKPFENDQLAARVRVAERILGLHETLHRVNAGLEQRVAERTVELEKALTAKSELLSRASHELRTPMNAILGFAQLLDLDLLSTQQRESVSHILTSGRRLLALIDRVLAVADSGSEELSFLQTSS